MDCGAPYSTYHLAGSGEPCTWAEVARWVSRNWGRTRSGCARSDASTSRGKRASPPTDEGGFLDAPAWRPRGSPRDSRAVVRSVLSTSHD
ncbi:hypothetical protein QJS66_07785 [Kocuria rhizophila]|nr:hypothetical protein QJS66_07785 [Kocuria rhizophila]